MTRSISKARRLLSLPLSELGGRARQELYKYIERQWPRSAAGELKAAEAAAALASAHPPVPGLRDATSSAEYVRARCPTRTAALLDAAERALAGEIELLGCGSVPVGPFPDWHTDPINGVAAPRCHWSRVPYLDFGRVGDSKCVWELNRHQFLVLLGLAFRLSEDPRYALRIWALVDSWIRENPPGYGINWASSLEVSLRAIAWCWAWHLCDENTRPHGERAARFIATLERHGRHLERYPSTYFSPNTHLTGEALGLCYLATAWPELPRAGVWWRKGSRILLEQIPRQVRADGLHFERSACYQLYTLDFYLHYMLLCAARDEPVAATLRAAVNALAGATETLRRPDGLLPNFGDEDGGRLLALDGTAPRDPSPTLATAAVLLSTPELWPGSESRIDAIWGLGSTPYRASDERINVARDGSPGAVTGRVFLASGFAVARRGDDYLLASAGLQHLGQSCTGHVHDDALGLELWHAGEPVVIDPGTYTYTADKPLRSWYRSAAAHTTATVDRRPAPAGDRTFRWSALKGGQVKQRILTDEYYCLELERHIGAGGTGLCHRRRIAYWPPAGLVIWDRFVGSGLHDLGLRYQFPSRDVELDAEAFCYRLKRALVTVAGPRSGRLWPKLVDSPVSERYGSRTAARAGVIETRATLPADIVTLILDRRVDSRTSVRLVDMVAPGTGNGRGGTRALCVQGAGHTSDWIVLQDIPAAYLELGSLSGPFALAWVRPPGGQALLLGGEHNSFNGTHELNGWTEVRLAGHLLHPVNDPGAD